MVGDRLLARGRREAALAHQLGEQLGVVDDLVVAAEVRVLVGERVEAVRAARDDLAHARLVERLDVLLGVGLEDVLVAHPPRGVAVARLARAEDREVDARGLQQLRRRLRRRARALVERRGAADPVEHLRHGVARLQHAHPEALGPGRALGLRLAPGVRLALDVAQHRLGLAREARLDHHQVAAQVEDVVDVLDVDRALAHACAAGDAVPGHLLEVRAGRRRAARRRPRRSRARRAPAVPRPRGGRARP